MKRTILSSVIAGMLGTLAGQAGAAEVWLCAKQTSKSMPDGTSVTMWGYAQSNASFADGCAAAATVPGPALTVPVGDSTLTIHLRNALTTAQRGEPVSVVIPGLNAAMNPVSVGGRITSFTAQANANGGTADYTWNNVAPGTYLYHSGTHPAVEVQMGLYGAVTKNEAAGQAYPTAVGAPDTSFVAEKTLLLSEVDPVLHQAIATGNYGTTLGSTIEYKPKYFLVDGEAVTTPATSTSIGPIGQPTLLRLINAGLKSHAMVLDGLRMTVVAEDGKLAPYAKDQASVLLGAQQTADVLVTPTADEDYALYDRIGISSTNGVDRFGGLLAVLNPNVAPFAVNPDAYSTDEDVALNVGAPGVLGNDTGGAAGATVATPPANGSLTLNPDGSFAYIPTGNFFGTDSFVYSATNGTITTQATVTLTVNPVNDAPAAVDDTRSGSEDTALNGATVLGNDTDPEGNPLTAQLVTGPANGALTLNPNGTFTYTPNANFNGVDSFTYQANDGQTVNNLSNTVTVTLNIAAVNDAPVVNAGVDQTIALPVVANLAGTATDVDGDALTTTWSKFSGPAGTVTFGNANALATTATFPATGTYVLRLTATDGVATVTDNIQVTVNTAVISTIYFSTVGNTNPTGLGGTADNADIYSWNGSAFSRAVDVTNIANALPISANVDGLKYIDGTHFYMSFIDNVTLPGLGTVQDEDIVFYNAGVWSVFFNGTPGLGASANQDIDAFSINTPTSPISASNPLYFSTAGNTNPTGLSGTADDADIYSWNGTTFARAVDMSTLGIPLGANIDGLKLVSASPLRFYVSFNSDVSVPGIGTVQDEDIVQYRVVGTTGTWSVYFNGTPGLGASVNQDIDAFDVIPTPP